MLNAIQNLYTVGFVKEARGCRSRGWRFTTPFGDVGAAVAAFFGANCGYSRSFKFDRGHRRRPHLAHQPNW